MNKSALFLFCKGIFSAINEDPSEKCSSSKRIVKLTTLLVKTLDDVVNP